MTLNILRDNFVCSRSHSFRNVVSCQSPLREHTSLSMVVYLSLSAKFAKSWFAKRRFKTDCIGFSCTFGDVFIFSILYSITEFEFIHHITNCPLVKTNIAIIK